MIGKNVRMGLGVTIQGGGRIGDNCRIGDGCTLKWGATLTAETILGTNVFLGPYAICLGGGFECHGHEPTRIDADVRIGAGAKIFAGVHVCSGARIGVDTQVREDITEPGTYVNDSRKHLLRLK